MSTAVSSGEIREIQLIQKAAGGDGDAFALLFEKHFETIYNYVLWLCNDPDQAEDLTQETFIRAHGSLKHLGPPWRIRPWLYRLAHNLFIDHARQRKPVHPLDPDAPLASSEDNPERQVMFEELSGPVHGALVRLSPNYREALVLREVQGFQYAEIADIMGVSVDHVKVLLHRARASFKDNYGLRLLVEKPTRPCTVLNELLDSFHDNELTPEQEAMVREHVKDCPSCQQRKRELAALVLLLQGQKYFKLPDWLRQRLLHVPDRPADVPHQAATVVSLPKNKPKPKWKMDRIVSAGVMGGLLALAGWLIIQQPIVLSPPTPPGGQGGGGGDDSGAPTPTAGSDVSPAVAPAEDTPTPTQSMAGCACKGTMLLCPDRTVPDDPHCTNQPQQQTGCGCQGAAWVCADGTRIDNDRRCVSTTGVTTETPAETTTEPLPEGACDPNVNPELCGCYCAVNPSTNAWDGTRVCNHPDGTTTTTTGDPSCPAPVCGNGAVEGVEECDGGGCGKGATCNADCTCEKNPEVCRCVCTAGITVVCTDSCTGKKCSPNAR